VVTSERKPTTLAQVLVIAPEDEHLTPLVIAALEHAWGELSAAELARKNVYQLAFELLAILPDPKYNNHDRLYVAEKLDTLLDKLGLGAGSATEAQFSGETLDSVKLSSHGPDHYRQLLYSAAQKRCSAQGECYEVSGGIYRTVDIRGVNGEVKEVIVLEGGSVRGTNIEVELYAPPGVSVRSSGTNVELKVYNLSWEELAVKARLS
jgi:hypothetical protein